MIRLTRNRVDEMNRLRNLIYSICIRCEDSDYWVSFIIVLFFIQLFVLEEWVQINVIDQHLNRKQRFFHVMSKDTTWFDHCEHFVFFNFIISLRCEHFSRKERDKMSLICFFDQLKQNLWYREIRSVDF